MLEGLEVDDSKLVLEKLKGLLKVTVAYVKSHISRVLSEDSKKRICTRSWWNKDSIRLLLITFFLSGSLLGLSKDLVVDIQIVVVTTPVSIIDGNCWFNFLFLHGLVSLVKDVCDLLVGGARELIRLVEEVTLLHLLTALLEHLCSSFGFLGTEINHGPLREIARLIFKVDGSQRHQSFASSKELVSLINNLQVIILGVIHEFLLDEFNHIGKSMRSSRHVSKRELSSINKGLDSLFDICVQDRSVVPQHGVAKSLRNVAHLLEFFIGSSCGVEEVQFVELASSLQAPLSDRIVTLKCRYLGQLVKVLLFFELSGGFKSNLDVT